MLRCVSLLLLLLLVVLLPLYTTEADSSLKNCLAIKSICNKNDTCKKNFKEMNRKCRFSDHLCFNDEYRVRCKDLKNDITLHLGPDSWCKCQPFKTYNEFKKCNDIFNRLHANPCTFVPPTTTEISSTNEITTEAETMTLPTTTTTEQVTTSPADDVMTTTAEIQDEIFEMTNSSSVGDSPVEEKLNSGNVKMTFFTAAGLVFLAGSVILVLSVVILFKIKPGTFSSKFSRKKKSENNVLLSYSPSSVITRSSRIEEESAANEELIPRTQELINPINT